MRLAILALACLTGYASLAHADGMTAEDKALVAQHAKKHGKKSHKKAIKKPMLKNITPPTKAA